MKTLRLICIVQLLFLSTTSCAQNKKMKTEVDKIKELGRDSIIQLALEITSFKIDENNFEEITISANHEDVYVNFTNLVVYIPMHSGFTTEISVSIIGRTTSYNTVNNNDDLSLASGQPNFYKPNETSKKVIQFVFDAINKSAEVGNISSENDRELNMTITEKDTFYQVLNISHYQESNFRIKKETGAIYDVLHAHISKIPLELEEGEEEMQVLFVNQTNSKVVSDIPSEISYKILKHMDREALIDLAKSRVAKYLVLLNEKPFDYSGVDTKVLKNSTVFLVYFEQSLKYVPLHSAHYYGFEVNLLEDNVSKLNRNNEATNNEFSYYNPSHQDIENIAFVKKAISYEKGQVIVVNEKEKYYEIGYETSGEKVDKKTGEVFDFWDRIYAPEEDPLVEIGFTGKE